jgi:hypothetical protein
VKAYFHKSFALERDNISKLLSFVSEHPNASREEIAVETGIGIGKRVSDGKVRPTIQYAIYSGLLEPEAAQSQTEILLSEVGKIVFERDRRLKSAVTQWVMHYFLCRSENESLIWSFFIHEFLPHYAEFDSEALEAELRRRFTDLSERINKENRRILTSCYTDGNALSKTRLVESDQRDRFIRGTTAYPSVYLAAYILAEIWEAKHGHNVLMVEPSVLLERGHLATTLNLNEGDLQNCLNEISAIGAISQMREAPPFQVARKWTDKLDLLRRAYEEN